MAADDNNIRCTSNIINSTTSSSMAETKRLLIVDDEPDITSVLRRGLEQHGNRYVQDPVKALSSFKVG
jgi:PleD family two-component response regulator